MVEFLPTSKPTCLIITSRLVSRIWIGFSVHFWSGCCCDLTPSCFSWGMSILALFQSFLAFALFLNVGTICLLFSFVEIISICHNYVHLLKLSSSIEFIYFYWNYLLLFELSPIIVLIFPFWFVVLFNELYSRANRIDYQIG